MINIIAQIEILIQTYFNYINVMLRNSLFY